MSGPIVLGLRLVLAIALYAFLGEALWMMWQELRVTSTRVAFRRIPPIRLEVRNKRRTPIVRAFSQQAVVLGRDPLVDVPLSDDAVSARHALLSFHDGQWWVSDLGSKNGTRLNREALTGPTVLTTGDEIGCGPVRVLVNVANNALGSSSLDGGRRDA
jgi:pSer/pThr/pTyr-binding forkhead associated (FHA) protein